MISTKKHITYVCSKVSRSDAEKVINKLSAELELIITVVDTVENIITFFSNPTYHVDYIAIDVEDLYNVENVDGFDIIKTISTMIHCNRHSKNKTVDSKPTKIVVMISDNTSYSKVKELLSMTEVSYLSLRYGGKVTYADVKESVSNFVSDGDRAPKFIIDFVRPKKVQHKDTLNDIKLTPRQKQVLKLVIDRGASNKIIAKMLRISESTVKLHMSTILKKYKVRNRTQLAVFAKNNSIT